MQSFRGAMVAVGAAAGVALVAGFAATGCNGGGGGTGPVGDGGEDATSDSMADTSPGTDGQSQDTGSDSMAAPDTATAVDSGMATDTGTAVDSSSTDASSDAGAVGDASLYLAFATSQAQAICNFYLGCCPGGTAAYNMAECVAVYQQYGWEGNVPLALRDLSEGNLAINTTQALNCVSQIATLDSHCGTQTAAEWTAVTQACELVVTGTLPQGSGPCHTSFECASNSYCSTTVDGGVCAPLATQGQPCDISTLADSLNGKNTGNPVTDYVCSYLASGNTGLFCDIVDSPDASTYGTCQPLRAAGQPCGTSNFSYYDDQACVTSAQLCGDNNLCGSTISNPYPGTCDFYKIQDAGGGG